MTDSSRWSLVRTRHSSLTGSINRDLWNVLCRVTTSDYDHENNVRDIRDF